MHRIEYLARCHCGGLTARYRTVLAISAWDLRACQCAFCRSHGALMTSDPEGELEFRSEAPERVSRYRFGSRAAEFLICRDCGVFVGVEMAAEAGGFGVLNVLSLRPLLGNLPAAQPMEFGAESPDVRRGRWERHWTPLVAARG